MNCFVNLRNGFCWQIFQDMIYSSIHRLTLCSIEWIGLLHLVNFILAIMGNTTGIVKF